MKRKRHVKFDGPPALQSWQADEVARLSQVNEFSFRNVTIFTPPAISRDNRPRAGKFGPRWGCKQ